MPEPDATTATDSDLDLITEPGLVAYGEQLCTLLRSFFASKGAVPTGAAIVVTLDTDQQPLDPPGIHYVFDDGSAEKAFLSVALHGMAEQHRATAVFFFAETWTVNWESEEERVAWRGRDWGQHPRAKEQVYCSMEHLEFAQRRWHAFITRDTAGSATLGDFACDKVESSRGRFTNFLRYAKREVQSTVEGSKAC